MVTDTSYPLLCTKHASLLCTKHAGSLVSAHARSILFCFRTRASTAARTRKGRTISDAETSPAPCPAVSA
uniref:Uncharacterized protein n=1 Tax=Arundo donax TaxID=35708 RepID=A0A0A8YB31_ARUDO